MINWALLVRDTNQFMTILTLNSPIISKNRNKPMTIDKLWVKFSNEWALGTLQMKLSYVERH